MKTFFKFIAMSILIVVSFSGYAANGFCTHNQSFSYGEPVDVVANLGAGNKIFFRVNRHVSKQKYFYLQSYKSINIVSGVVSPVFEKAAWMAVDSINFVSPVLSNVNNTLDSGWGDVYSLNNTLKEKGAYGKFTGKFINNRVIGTLRIYVNFPIVNGISQSFFIMNCA